MRDDQEKILVVERQLLDRLGMFQGLTLDLDRYLPTLLSARHYRFVARHAAEQDESLKQLIPYFLICHGDQIWSYTRGKQSGEDRLVAKVSIGIGGHINHLDENLFEDIYSRAATRELEEEVSIPGGYTQQIVALLNDETTPVGRVHLGVIHVLRTSATEVRKREGVITDAGFRSRAELLALRNRMESWSQICLDAADNLLARGQAT
jgi:predicted NUDIX family phosphoesterase